MYNTVTLEVSLKPFYQTEEPEIRRVCAEIYEQWRPLLKNRPNINVMLWVGDGSELLDYAGSLDDEFEWAYYIGTANLGDWEKDDDPTRSLHEKRRKYRKDPPVMTYRILKTVIEQLKLEGKKAFPAATVRVGETFDIGPEFARSDFKYNRHKEISCGSTLDTCGFVDSTALLNRDDRVYAAYPNGIPDQTPLGLFLGKQANCFLKDMGFDYLWLSNGLGFSANPWDTTGKVFDGKDFYPEKLTETREKVFEFWRLFREGCPDIELHTRGTNNSVGIDYASDGVPLYDIYRGGFNIVPPPNSPWAALNDHFGLEIMGHMTRICELPGDEFLFRYYIHDPWWLNSPWYDRYDGQPTDIYLPMAISRMDANGKVQNAELLNILSIDNSFGDMPDSCVYEPLPHLLKAEKDAADEPAPLVWVYPMREYTTADSREQLYEMYYGDTYISQAINHGFPLNCVVSTDNFLLHDLSVYQKSVLVSPVPENPAVTQQLQKFVQQGGKVICYGSKERLTTVSECGFLTVDITDSPDAIRKQLGQTGYCINFACKPSAPKPPAMTIARNKNGFFWSVYNPDTTTDTYLNFPLGAPILNGGETELTEQGACYRFNRCEHRECRIFVRQNGGVISCHEAPPVNAKYRRSILVKGLKDATVCYFPEAYCAETAEVCDGLCSDFTPIIEDGWELIRDEQQGTYWRKEHVSGDHSFVMPFADEWYLHN